MYGTIFNFFLFASLCRSWIFLLQSVILDFFHFTCICLLFLFSCIVFKEVEAVLFYSFFWRNTEEWFISLNFVWSPRYLDMLEIVQIYFLKSFLLVPMKLKCFLLEVMLDFFYSIRVCLLFFSSGIVFKEVVFFKDYFLEEYCRLIYFFKLVLIVMFNLIFVLEPT